jgi:hypothetical protein
VLVIYAQKAQSVTVNEADNYCKCPKYPKADIPTAGSFFFLRVGKSMAQANTTHRMFMSIVARQWLLSNTVRFLFLSFFFLSYSFIMKRLVI